MSEEVEWGQYQQAYKAIHDKIAEVLAKLDNEADPALFDILAATVTDLKRITRMEFPAEFPVPNLGQIINGDFEIFIGGTVPIIPGWLIGSKATISGIDRFSGFKALALQETGGPTYYKGVWQFFSPPIATKYIKSFSLMHKCVDYSDVWYLYIQLFYSDGTNTIQTQIASYGAWAKLDLTYDTNKFIVAIHIWTDCTVADSFLIDTISLNYEEAIQIRGEADPATAIINTTGDNTIATPASGKRLYIKKIHLSNRDATKEPRISFKFGAAGAEHFPITLAAYGTVIIDFVGMNWKGGVDEALIAVRDSTTATVDCTIMKEEMVL